MIINKKFNYQKLEKAEGPNGDRVYMSPKGYALPSVTTILSATEDKTGLIAWRERVGDKKADQIRDESCALGSLMHNFLENHIMQVPHRVGTNPIRITASNMANQIINREFQNINEIWGIEAGLFYDGLFAGTTDLVGVYNNKPAIMDYKTSKALKTIDKIENYMCQLSAYCMAHDDLYGTNIKQGVIFMVTRNLEFKTFVIEGDDFDHYRDKWLSRLEQYYNK